MNATTVARIYTRAAPVYDAWTRLTETDSLRAALSAAAVRDGESVLEVAVGTGVVFAALLRANPRGRNVGIDLTEAMLRRARAKALASGAPFELMVGDARDLPFARASFDVVVCTNMLGLVALDDVNRILDDMRRVLRPGGRLVLVGMLPPTTRAARWVYRLAVERLGGWRTTPLEPHVRQAGYTQITRTVVAQLGMPSEVVVARRPHLPNEDGF